MQANEKGSQHGWHAETLFLCAHYRRIYTRSLTAADSRALPILNVRLSALGNAGSVVQPASEFLDEAFPQFFFLIASTSF
jgi:hypothetical protein